MILKLKQNIKGKNIRIVFPEGSEPRVLEAVAMLLKEDLVTPILLGEKKEILKMLENYNIDKTKVEIIEPETYSQKEEMLNMLKVIRKDKNTEEELRTWIKQNNYFGVLLVKQEYAHGMVGGALYPTKDIIKPAFQIIKTKENVNKASSVMILLKNNEIYFMADCAIQEIPTSDDLAEIAIQTANTVREFGFIPKVSLLSHSTKGSASGELVDKVKFAIKKLDELKVDFLYDGEHQFDTAIEEEIKKLKDKSPRFSGVSNTFIFPDIQSGNIGYKIARSLGGFKAIGPIMQGLNAPINDLSRGCTAEEIYDIVIITANQALKRG